MTAPLRRVLVRPPQAADLADFGAEVVYAEEPLPGALDAIYAYDPALVADAGAILLRPGKELRRAEPAALGRDLERAGVPIAARLEAPALAEGGDTLWLDRRTLLVGRSYRTNDAGIEALRRTLPDVDVIAFDLPHLRGPGEVLHLLSLLSPVDDDLVVAYPPLLPTRLVELLRDCGISVVEVPDEEFETMGPNVLALAPRVALALDGNDETRRRMERAGVEVRVYLGRELSKGDGGPTCLTLPVLRAATSAR